MRDRVGLMVGPQGHSHVMLLDNQPRAVVKLACEGDGHEGLQLFKWDMEKKKIHVKALTFDGDKVQTIDRGD